MRGSGGVCCLCGRGSWWWSVVVSYLMLFCRITWLTGSTEI